MHIFPQLRKLEDDFPDELAVIGVHSAKFPGERETSNIAHAIHRHGIRHPVVNDCDMRIWDAYTVRAWPTLVFVDPSGYVIRVHEGEASYEGLRKTIGAMVEEFRQRGTLAPQTPRPMRASADAAPHLLHYPGKVLVHDEALYVADTGHGRVLEAVGGTLRAFGEGLMVQPQGMARLGGDLFVADPEAHRIWAVDLASGAVRTAAGTGQQGWPEGVALAARQTELNSPWDVLALADGRTLLIAMAGQHRLWRFVPAQDELSPFSGSGRESLRDGPPSLASYAQPSGLTLSHDGTVYVADSESSSIRAVAPDGRAATVVGKGLFDFGDRDGEGADVLLQHPLDVTFGAGTLYIADAFNGKIKRCDPATRSVQTVVSGLAEPGGIAYLTRDGRPMLVIANTNAHTIALADLGTGILTELALP